MPMSNEPLTPETAEQESGGTGVIDYLGMTLHSGVAPLETRYAQINSCYRRLPVAYRSFTYVNSVIEGVIPPEKYAFAADETERGERMSRYNMVQAMRAVEKLQLAGRHVSFVTARCSPRLVRQDDFYGYVKSLLEERGFLYPERLCLEFPRSLFFEDPEQARMAVLSMKLLKVKTMLTGCGDKDAPLTPLLNLPVDYVVLSPLLTGLADHRDHSASVAALIAFLRSIPCGVIGEGAYNDEQISALSRADCFGYIPSSGYEGTATHGSLRMTLEDAVAQPEEEAM